MNWAKVMRNGMERNGVSKCSFLNTCAYFGPNILLLYYYCIALVLTSLKGYLLNLRSVEQITII